MRKMIYSIVGVMVVALLVGGYYMLTKDNNGNSRVGNTHKELSKSRAGVPIGMVAGARKEFRDGLLRKGELDYYKTKKKLPTHRVTITADENYKYLSESLGLDFKHIDSSIPLDQRHINWVGKLYAVSQAWNLPEAEKNAKMRRLIEQNQLMLDLFNQILIKYMSNEISFDEQALAVQNLMLWNEAFNMKELSDHEWSELNFWATKDIAPQAIEAVLTPPVTEVENMFPAFKKDFEDSKNILTILSQEQIDKLVIAEKAKWLKEHTRDTKLNSGEISLEQYEKEKAEDDKLIEDAKMAVVGEDIYNKYLNPNSEYIGSNIQGEAPEGVTPEHYKDYLVHR